MLVRRSKRSHLPSPGRPPANAIRVLAGEYKTSRDGDDYLVTVLGSCIAACVRNPATGFGGINHFMLPNDAGEARAERGGFFGQSAMDALVHDVVMSGCTMDDLEVKIFGGADLYRSSIAVGQQNLQFVLNYLERRRLRPLAVDVGGSYARKIVYVPATGIALRRFIAPDERNGGFQHQRNQ